MCLAIELRKCIQIVLKIIDLVNLHGFQKLSTKICFEEKHKLLVEMMTL